MTLQYDFSVAEIGAVVSALQSQYSERQIGSICKTLCDEVYAYFESIGMPEFYDDWLEEFEIIE